MSDIVMKQESTLTNKTTPTMTDLLRLVGSDDHSYKALVSDVAKAIIETYAGSTVAGSAQSVKSALDALNSKLLNRDGGDITPSNVDSLTSPAIYSRYIEANNITGVSAAGGAFGLFIVTNNTQAATRVGQYIFMPNNGYVAFRYKSGTSWSSWRGMQMPVLS